MFGNLEAKYYCSETDYPLIRTRLCEVLERGCVGYQNEVVGISERGCWYIRTRPYGIENEAVWDIRTRLCEIQDEAV